MRRSVLALGLSALAIASVVTAGDGPIGVTAATAVTLLPTTTTTAPPPPPSCPQGSTNYIETSDPAFTGKQCVHVVAPPSEELRPAVIFVHGGAWVGGNFEQAEYWQRDAASLATDENWATFNIEYEKVNAPKGQRRFRQTGDVIAAIRYVHANAATYKVDPNRIALVGDSAGAHLSMMVGLSDTGDTFDASLPAPLRAIVAWSGPTELEVMARDVGCANYVCSDEVNGSPQWVGRMVQNFMGCLLDEPVPGTSRYWDKCPDNRYRDTSPIHVVRADDRAQAVFMVYALQDPLVNALRQQVPMIEKLDNQQVPNRRLALATGLHGRDLRGDAWEPTKSFLRECLAVVPCAFPMTQP